MGGRPPLNKGIHFPPAALGSPPGPPLLKRGGCRPFALPALEVPSFSVVDRTHTHMFVFLIGGTRTCSCSSYEEHDHVRVPYMRNTNMCVCVCDQPH